MVGLSSRLCEVLSSGLPEYNQGDQPVMWGRHQSRGTSAEFCELRTALPIPAMTALGRFGFALSVLMLASPALSVAQTFEVNQNGQVASPQAAPKSARKGTRASGQPQASASSSSGMGWGSSIEVARQARAAQEALNKGDYNSAVSFAERAAKSAPQNTDFWFLLGYAARLSGQYSKSLDAYKHGLQNQPSSIQGLSGMAQTYAKMGRTDEAQKILQQVLAANPRSATDLNLAGELALSSDPQRAVDFLARAERVQSNARTELLLARAYVLLKQPEKSRQFLELARSKAPRNPDVLRAVAGFYRDQRQYDQAIAVLSSSPSKPPDLLAELGYTYQLAGKKKEAASSYARAAEGRSKEPGLQLSAAQAFLNAGDLKRARLYVQKAEALAPNSYRLHAVRAQIASQENRTADAIRDYEQALSAMPEGVPEGVLYPVELRLSLREQFLIEGNEAAAQQQIVQAQSALQTIDFKGAERPEFLRLRGVVAEAAGRHADAERDLKEALALEPSSVNITLNYANLLWKLEKKEDSRKLFQRALELDPVNASALSSLGYLSRDMGDAKAAEAYFLKLESLYPDNYVPYLALGDMYTGARQFDKAQESYEKGYKLAPHNALILAGGTNAGIEGHKLDLAKSWLDRATPAQNENPQLMRERERYLTFIGKYAESAALGYKVIEKMPHDAEAPIYLAYDLLYLGRFDEARQIVARFEPEMPKDKDLPLIAGYIHVHDGLYPEALKDFTRALERDPKMATGYVNRGYVLNDMRMGSRAEADFRKAIELKADYGEAHLGLAYAYLQTRHAKLALKEAEVAERLMHESAPTHLAKAEAYRQQILFASAIKEYEAALRFQPNNLVATLAMADAQYRLHKYSDALQTLNAALKLSPNDPQIYAQMAYSYARLNQRDNAMRVIQMAEQNGGGSDRILLATGNALLMMGDRKAAMERFGRALDVVGGDRVATRLSLAHLFARQGRFEDARQQVAFGFAEARIDNTQPITPEHLLEAADVFLAIHDFDLARKYLERAQQEGADPDVVAVGMANAYLAQGETASAEAQLASLGNTPENEQNYDYVVAMGNVYRQKQDNARALSMFARATQMNASDDSAQRAEFDLAESEGRHITDNVGMVSNISLSPIFEDINIYQIDARLFGTGASTLPPPRSSYESLGIARFKTRPSGFPAITGFVEERNARGRVSIPSTLFIQDRNTYDTSFNAAINPVFHLGSSTVTLTPGLQFTLRRDTLAPTAMNQNLFRQFLYVGTGSFWNWISFRGQGIHETGPFTNQDLHSRDLSGQLEFTVGRPWGRTSLLSGYAVRDILFRPAIREYYTTNAYVGIQRRFGSSLTAAVMGSYLRSWRVQDNLFAMAQAIRPAVRISYQPNSRWSVQGSFMLSRGEGFHAYDNVQNEITVSYVKGIRGALNDGNMSTSVSYPLRFSVGLQQQTFYNFTGSGSTSMVLPIVRLTLF